mmetsp:Transcript_5724/g.8521  ORF Transcript_5724/g.8521 Transcript_5724/m.8521 type:complete len:1130 (+) Transcript_5724:164-3553(+)|eukprot:CAMPEP_0197232354 /NCGR_PEP_ID=MMETSP1429-20130617/417_1 /TAXON_ID=49237 /ORGANISM="Chaetoceros  sp., Strain UNC1202" /LENGTH=1129 /DNA_ID=CAMNT_0042690341 /DNA_START=553 /DNA_END=3942 /DNA_ORIENTATION=-
MPVETRASRRRAEARIPFLPTERAVERNPESSHLGNTSNSGNTSAKNTDTQLLRLLTLNIIDGRNSRLNQAIRCLKQMNVDIGILTETKLSNDMYTKSFLGYRVVATKMEGNTGGVALVYRDRAGWGLESTICYGPNVIRSTLVAGDKRKYIIGVYIPPSEENGKTLDFIREAVESVPNSRWPIIMLGDLNVNLKEPGALTGAGTNRRLETAALVDAFGLLSMATQYRQRKKRLGRTWTWRMRRENATHGGVNDYILSDTRRCFRNCQVLDPRFETDHRALLGVLELGPIWKHERYVKGRQTCPFRPPNAASQNRADRILADLVKATAPPVKEHGRGSSWISTETWRLIDQKALARKRGDRDAGRRLKHRVRLGLRKDRKARAAAAASAAEGHLQSHDIRRAFGAIRGWYRDVGPPPVAPSLQDMDEARRGYIDMFQRRDSPGELFPIEMEPFPVVDTAPTVEEVQEAIGRLNNGKSAGASGVKPEHLKEWMRAANPTENGVAPDPAAVVLWEKLLELIRLAFEEGILPKTFGEGIMVMIPKAEPGQYRPICLLDVVYKVVASIINRRLHSAIKFDDALHGNMPKRGTGTAIMEAKLLAQLQMRSDKPLFLVFIDLKKAYYSLDRGRALQIFQKYGMGPNLCRIVETIWAEDSLAPRRGGYYGRKFRCGRGVRAGDTMSPTLFNICVDAIIRHWRQEMNPTPTEETALFYADDGMFTGTDEVRFQSNLNFITGCFAKIGLVMNAEKTKFMVMKGAKRVKRLGSEAYWRRMTENGLTHRERCKEKVQCLKCGVLVGRPSLGRHQRSKTCLVASKDYEAPTPVRDRVAGEQAATPVVDPGEYTVSIPALHTDDVACPVPGCPFQIRAGRPGMRTVMRLHFRAKHVEDGITIEEEGRLPRCSQCGLFANNSNTPSHKATATCQKFAKLSELRKRAVLQEASVRARFYVGQAELERVEQFKYLGRILDETDDDDFAALRQLERARNTWRRFGGILRSEGACPRVKGFFYKAIMQAVLLYGSESWTITQQRLNQFQSLHSRTARHLTGNHIRLREDETWFCPPTSDVLEEAGLQTIEEYILRRRTTVKRLIRGRDIYQKCIRSTAIGVTARRTVWWQLGTRACLARRALILPVN